MTIAAPIKELPHRPFNDSVENKARRILQELPHLTAKDVAQVAAELVADAEAATQIAEIIKQAALQILRCRAGQGDELAREQLYKATGARAYDDEEIVGLGCPSAVSIGRILDPEFVSEIKGDQDHKDENRIPSRYFASTVPLDTIAKH
jgi:hypothetical protein